jgi:methionyl-tRNA synthetase
MLMAAEIALPERIFVHGFLLMDGEKMSKSLGNVLDPFTIIDRFGSDALRFYCLRDVTFGQDGSVSTVGFEDRYEKELANELGNLASRTIAMVHRYREGTVPGGTLDPALRRDFDGLVMDVSQRLDAADLSGALEAIWVRVRRLNRYVEERKPWELARDEARSGDLDEVLASLSEGLRAIAVLLWAYMPQTIEKLLEALGALDTSLGAAPFGAGSLGPVAELAPLFPKER